MTTAECANADLKCDQCGECCINFAQKLDISQVSKVDWVERGFMCEVQWKLLLMNKISEHFNNMRSHICSPYMSFHF